jgi:hypothetical protein
MDNFRDVLVAVLHDLRQRILRNDLPREVVDTLSWCLPSDDAGWDLNKRLLKVFRKAYQRGQQFDEVLEALNLADDEYAYATNQDPRDVVRRLWKAFTPWSHSR